MTAGSVAIPTSPGCLAAMPLLPSGIGPLPPPPPDPPVEPPVPDWLPPVPPPAVPVLPPLPVALLPPAPVVPLVVPPGPSVGPAGDALSDPHAALTLPTPRTNAHTRNRFIPTFYAGFRALPSG